MLFSTSLFFKISNGYGLGIDLQDTENWPLLQSFALDSVVCPTGFFTSRYAVIDITETLDVRLLLFICKCIYLVETN
jgi:hypothetical protein